MNEALLKGLPLPADWPPALNYAGSLLFSDELVSALAQADRNAATRTTGEVAREILITRYEPLFHQVPSIRTNLQQMADKSQPFYCPSEYELKEAPQAKQIRSAFATIIQQEYLPLFVAVPRDRRDIWLGDYIEVVVLNFVESVDQVASTLQCLASRFA